MKREADKNNMVMKECTFQPERVTKKLDDILIKHPTSQSGKNNKEVVLNQYERLYRNYKDRADKLDHQRQNKYQHEQALINRLHSRSKSKSNNKLRQLGSISPSSANMNAMSSIWSQKDSQAWNST